MKKTLSLILALLMSVSCATTIFADDAAVADNANVVTTAAVDEAVDAGEAATPYDRAIIFLKEYEIIKGDDTGLHAEREVKRFEMALFIGRICTGWVQDKDWEDGPADNSGFTDLKGTYAEKVLGAMSYVSQKGVINGYPDGTFKPESTVTYRDALVMAVRALGHKGLEYPWGYIQTAVELGLTDGISGVAYTDEINRGVAAQIIYNAMFAENSKLAVANFDRAFGWVDALVTSTVINNTTVDMGKNDERANFGEAKYDTKSGYVGVQIINKNGTLDSTVYYISAKPGDNGKDDMLGLAEGHADELALGTPYAMLLETSADGTCKLVDFDKYEATVTTNNGRTDNDGKAYAVVDNITPVLAKYTIVDKYSTNVLVNQGRYNNELILKTPAKFDKVIGIDYGKNPYAFDWNTGDILVKQADGKYAVAWYYDATYNYYFQIKTNGIDKNGDPIIVGINVLDEADVAELRKAITEACQVKVATYHYATAAVTNPAPLYASLSIYNVNGKAYGTYETYGFGLLSQGTAACTGCAGAPQRAALFVNGGFIDYLESADCGADGHFDGIWWQNEYAPVLAGGAVATQYAIYGYNPVTKELKVLKTIEAYSKDLVDADTYYATGIVRGFKLSSGTPYVVIGDEKIELSSDFGTYAYRTNDNTWRAYLSSKLGGELFNEFVTYYLLDGKIVEIAKCDAGKATSYIVVDDYAGISSDGYIVVYGWNTVDAKYGMYRIAVYDGWYNGDLFWYGKEVYDEFIKGNIYYVSSYDKTNDVYFVDVLGQAEKLKDNAGNVVRDENEKPIYYADFSEYNPTKASMQFKSGYRVINDGDSGAIKVSSSDKYIIIGQAANNNKYTPISVFDGKVTDNTWKIKNGYFINGVDNKAGRTWLVLAKEDTEIVGFNWDAVITDELVLSMGADAWDMLYDGHGLAENEWYLNGATQYEQVVVYNFYTAAFEYKVNATNERARAGRVYRTVNGRLYDLVGKNLAWDTIWAEMKATFTSQDHNSDDIGNNYTFIDNVTLERAWCVDDAAGRNAFSYNYASEKIFGLVDIKVNNLVSSIKTVIYDGSTVKTFGVADYDKLLKTVAGKDNARVVGDIVVKMGDTISVVIYVKEARGETPAPTYEGNFTVDSNNYVDVTGKGTGKADAAIQGSVSGKFDKEGVATINSIAFDFVGKAVRLDTHAGIKADGYFFDILNNDDLLDWDAVVWDDINKTTRDVYGTQIKTTSYAYSKDCTIGCDSEENSIIANGTCGLIKTIDVDLDKTITLEVGESVKIRFAATYGKHTAGSTVVKVLPLIITNNGAGELTVAFDANYDGPSAVIGDVIADIVK